MKQIKDFIELFEKNSILTEHNCNEELSVEMISYNSMEIQENTLFFCKGAHFKEQFLFDALNKGAVAYVSEKKYDTDAPCILVSDIRKSMYLSANFFYDNVWDKLNLVGITGTKGKTTTTYLVKSILEAAGIKTGLIGTIESIIGDKHIPSVNTTPESFVVQEMFAEMVKAGLDAVVMEVSSQALMLHRVSGFTFDIGVFTNLEPDHIGTNEHKDFDDYMHCKSLLFQQCKKGIFNGDSEHLEGILKGHTCDVETFGYGEENDLRATNIELLNEKGALGVKYHANGLVDYDVEVNVPGSFSVYNSLTAIAICHHFGVEEDAIKQAGIEPSARAESLDVAAFVRLANVCESLQAKSEA